jgi:rare lipoprotein A
MNAKQLLGLAGLLWLITIICHSAESPVVASYYGSECAGRNMANGQPFNPKALTAASWRYPLGTRLLVTYHENSVIVIVTDRGPARRLHRDIDLSEAAFKQIADTRLGLIIVNIKPL